MEEKNHKWRLALALLALSAALGAGGSALHTRMSDSDSRLSSAHSTAPIAPGSLSALHGGNPAVVGAKRDKEAFASPAPVVYSAYFMRDILWDSGGNMIVIVDHELDPGGGEWVEFRTENDVSFELVDVDSALGNMLVIAGRSRNGDTVIEKWTIPAWTGGLNVFSNPSIAPLGTPRGGAPLSLNVQIAGATVFTPAPSRGVRPEIKREEVFRGSPLNGVVSLTVEPHGRFVYVLAGNPRTLWVLDMNDPDPVPVPALPWGQNPDFSSANSITALRHQSLGRTFMVDHDAPAPGDGANAPLMKTLLYDHNEDGYLDDSWSSAGENLFWQAFPIDSFVWDEFPSHWVNGL